MKEQFTTNAINLKSYSISESDKIIVMSNGKIQAIGTHDELLANNDIYKEIYYSQMKGSEAE